MLNKEQEEVNLGNYPLVSVIVPCFNRAHFLVPTLESILKQDYPNIECIVVDGGSSDNTLDILKSYGDKIKWISEPDKGHADAINKGWRMSKGSILAWLNADDVWSIPRSVCEAVAYLQDHPEVGVVYGDCGAIDAEGNLVGMSYMHEWDLAYAVEYCDHCIPQPAAFMRRSILEKVGWLDTAFYQKKDHELWLRIGLVGQIHYIPTLLAYYCVVKGLTFDGKTAAPACIQVTTKFFSLPNLPPDISRKKRRAFSNSYIQGMLYAFVGGPLWKIIFSYALRAVLMDPTNTVKVLQRLNHYVAAGAVAVNQPQPILTGLKLLNLPGRIFRIAKRLVKRFTARPRIPNLLGDRLIENSWIAAQMPSGPGEALDFGPEENYVGLIAAQKNFNVTAVDLQSVSWLYVHPNIHFIHGDILKLPLSEQSFDLIISCSTIEHVGLVGRYGVIESRSNGDIEVMALLHRLLKPDGIMLLTLPVGQDAVMMPVHRVYGIQRLPQLLRGYEIEKEAFWVKDDQNRWVISSKEVALNFKASGNSFDGLQNVYALGCFVLRKKNDALI